MDKINTVGFWGLPLLLLGYSVLWSVIFSSWSSISVSMVSTGLNGCSKGVYRCSSVLIGVLTGVVY